MDGLKDAHRAAIIATLAANDRVERAVLFGSRATGTNTVSSDVDIALFGDRLTLTDQARLAAALDEIPMAQSVDLLLYDSIQDRTLREHIRHHGVAWYMRPARVALHDTASESGSEWQVVELEDVSSDEPGSIAIGPFGSRMRSDVYTPSGVPVIRGTNISTVRAWRNEWVYVSDDFADGLPNCNVREGDLVFPHQGSIGEVAIIPGDRARYMLSTSLMKFRPDPKKVSPLFLFYYFRSDTGRAEIMRYSSQVGTPGIGQPLTSLRQFRVPIPPREEQERIAGILSVLDDKIEVNRRMNATLEAMARALFRSWFVDFDPVRAKMQGRDTGLPRDIADLFPDRMVNSELGEIPVGWEVKPLKDLLALAYGNALRAEGRRRDGNVPVYGSRGQIGWHDRRLVRGPGIVVGRKGNPGIVTWVATDFFPIDTTFYVVPKDHYTLCFLFFALQGQDLPAIAADSVVPGLNRSLACMNRQVVPPGQLVKHFSEYVGPTFTRSYQIGVESLALALLRDTLLPRLISGGLRLKDAENSARRAL